ncbi:hypothetical protein [Nonomuraea sp. NPDC002799]
MGTTAGLIAAALAQPWAIMPFFVVAGWLAGVIAGEIAFGRMKGRTRRALGMRLANPALTALWTAAAAVSSGIAFSTFLRAFSHEVTAAQRLGAVATFAVVAVVQTVVSDLHRRPLPAGPADLVGAELATRSRTARSALGAGTAVALGASASLLPDPLPGDWGVLALPLLIGLPLVAWFKAGVPWPVPTAGTRRTWAWAAACVVLTGAGLAAGWYALDARPVEAAPFSQPDLTDSTPRPFRYAATDGTPRTWVLLGLEDRITLEHAATRAPAPFALSGDGTHVVYLHEETRRLVLHDVSSAERRDLTGPLAGADVPGEVVLSRDGRYVSLDADVIDTRTGVRTRLAGVGRVIGFGPDGVVATTGRRATPGAPDTELLTFDLRGVVRTRVPFDPTLEVLLTPDGRDLTVVTGDEVLTMDPRTGKVRGHAKMRLPADHGEPRALTWARDGRLLVGDRDDAYHLVDPRTGRTEPVPGMPGEQPTMVFGSMR